MLIAISRRPSKYEKSDRSARDRAEPRPGGAAAARDAGGRQRAQHGQHDGTAEHGPEVTDIVGGDADADDRDAQARIREYEIGGDHLRAGSFGDQRCTSCPPATTADAAGPTPAPRPTPQRTRSPVTM